MLMVASISGRSGLLLILSLLAALVVEVDVVVASVLVTVFEGGWFLEEVLEYSSLNPNFLDLIGVPVHHERIVLLESSPIDFLTMDFPLAKKATLVMSILKAREAPEVSAS